MRSGTGRLVGHEPAASCVSRPRWAGALGATVVGSDLAASVLTENTTLQRNVVGCPGTGLVVAGDGVALDLNGHKVSGSGTGTGVEIQGAGAVVHNGSIVGFGDGVDFTSEQAGGALKHLRIVRNGAGVYVEPILRAYGAVSIEDSVIAENAGAATSLTPIGSRDFTLVRSRVTGNGGRYAVYMRLGGLAIFEDNVISGNAGDGVFTRDVVARFVGNTVSRNGGNGIDVFDSSATPYPYFFANNTANRNGKLGISFNLEIIDPSYADGGGNTARGNGDPRQCVGISCTPKRAFIMKGCGKGRDREGRLRKAAWRWGLVRAGAE